MLRLTPEAPLVGFHGMASEDSLDSLGLILVDTLNPRCQFIKPSLNKELEFLAPYSEVAQDLVVENSITPEEQNRAKAIEAILAYDSLAKARESKEEVLR